MLKKINIDLEDADKQTIMEACKKRGVTLKEVFMALFDDWSSKPDKEAMELLFKYRQHQIDSEINRLTEEKIILQRKSAQAKLQETGRVAIAFAKGRGYITADLSEHIISINCAYAIKKNALDAGIISENDFKEFVEKHLEFISNEETTPELNDKETNIKNYKKLGFSEEEIVTLLLDSGYSE